MTLFTLPKLNETSNLSAWLDRGIVVAVALACAVALSLNVADPDLWGHVQYGRDALAHGLPITTTYSYVAAGYPWINHEIVAEYALAIINDSLGGPGLLMIKCLLGVAIVGVIYWRARRQGAGLIAGCSLALLVAITLGNHWSLRPQIASYVSFALLLALLSYCFEGWEGKWQLWRRTSADGKNEPLEYSLDRMKLLWLAPPLFMVWTNSHGGFLAGLCIYLAYLGLRGLEALAKKGRAADGLLLRFAVMGAGAVAATFINPYGVHFHRWLFDDLRVPRPEIVEWRAPALFETQFLPFWLLLAVVVASVALTRRSRDFTHVAILGLIVWQALTHHRHIAFFAIAAAWWLPLHFDSLLARLGIDQTATEEPEFIGGPVKPPGLFASMSPYLQTVVVCGLVLAICASSGQLATRLSTLKVERSNYPVAAFEFIAKRGLTGKMVCTFNWAQYALAAFGPRQAGDDGILVQVDGRCRTSYSQAMLDEHFDFLFGNIDPSQRYRDPCSGPLDPTRVLQDGQPDLVLISRLQKPSVEVMERQKGKWVLLYQDGLAQLWGRAARFDVAESPAYLPREKREIGEAPQRGYVAWPALPPYQPRTHHGGAVKEIANAPAEVKPSNL
jgi:hypothetical protein